MFNKDAAFKINIQITVTVSAQPPVVRRTDGQPIPRTPVQSSVIKSVGYAFYDRVLVIEFVSGKIYEYRRVGEWVIEELLNSDSAGLYFNRYIKGAYETREITDAA